MIPIFRAHSMRAGYSSTLIAKLLIASTFHGWASQIFFHPKPAARTLFKSCTSCEIYERLIFWVHAHILTILIAGHVVMEITSALQTVTLMAIAARKVTDCWIKFKEKVAVRGRAPRSTTPISLHILVHHEVFVFFIEFRGHKVH